MHIHIHKCFFFSSLRSAAYCQLLQCVQYETPCWECSSRRWRYSSLYSLAHRGLLYMLTSAHSLSHTHMHTLTHTQTHTMLAAFSPGQCIPLTHTVQLKLYKLWERGPVECGDGATHKCGHRRPESRKHYTTLQKVKALRRRQSSPAWFKRRERFTRVHFSGRWFKHAAIYRMPLLLASLVLRT